MRAFVSSVVFLLTCAAVAFPVTGAAQDKSPKLAVMNIQAAIAQCNEGKEAAKELREKFAPKRAALRKQQEEITDLQNQLKNQSKTLSDEARTRLIRQVDDKTRAFNRANQDATTEFQEAEQDAVNRIGRKMLGIVSEHAQKNGYALVLDISSPQTPVLYADQSLDITQKVIDLYNASTTKKSSSAAPGTPAGSSTKTVAAAKSAAVKPAARAASKP